MNDSLQAITQKAMRYCAYKERCIHDVTRKLIQWEVTDTEIQSHVLDFLKKEGMVDEQRFATIFARSKLRQNKWGRIKIRHALNAKFVHKDYIEQALREIPEEEYREVLEKLAGDKLERGMEKTQILKGKRYLLQKGFELEEISSVLKNMGVDT